MANRSDQSYQRANMMQTSRDETKTHTIDCIIKGPSMPWQLKYAHIIPLRYLLEHPYLLPDSVSNTDPTNAVLLRCELEAGWDHYCFTISPLGELVLVFQSDEMKTFWESEGMAERVATFLRTQGTRPSKTSLEWRMVHHTSSSSWNDSHRMLIACACGK